MMTNNIPAAITVKAARLVPTIRAASWRALKARRAGVGLSVVVPMLSVSPTLLWR
jgi:hypothetical protein